MTYLHNPTGMRQNEIQQQEQIDEHKQKASIKQGEEGAQGEMWVRESQGSNGITRKMSYKDIKALGQGRGQTKHMWKWQSQLEQCKC